jgi:hypothetical protein
LRAGHQLVWISKDKITSIEFFNLKEELKRKIQEKNLEEVNKYKQLN